MTLYQCPAHNGGCQEAVEVDFGTFSDTTVTIEACNQLREVGVSDYTMKKSAAAEFKVDEFAMTYGFTRFGS